MDEGRSNMQNASHIRAKAGLAPQHRTVIILIILTNFSLKSCVCGQILLRK